MASGSGLPKWAWVLIIGGGVVVLGIVALGLIATLALPGLSQARIGANEASAVGHARSVYSAEAIAAMENGGYYVPFECLQTPASCLAGYTGPAFLPELSRMGYSPRFVPGPLATPDERREASAKAEKSYKTFAFLMVPDKEGETGRRTFCIDATGQICSTEVGAVPETSGGRCSGCTPLR